METDEKLTEMQDEVEQLTVALQKKTQDVENQTKLNERLRQEVEDYENKCGELEEGLGRLEDLHRRTENSFVSKMKREQTQQEKIDKMKKELHDEIESKKNLLEMTLTAKLMEKDQTIKKTEENNKTLEEEIDKERQRNIELQRKVERLEQLRDEMQQIEPTLQRLEDEKLKLSQIQARYQQEDQEHIDQLEQQHRKLNPEEVSDLEKNLETLTKDEDTLAQLGKNLKEAMQQKDAPMPDRVMLQSKSTTRPYKPRAPKHTQTKTRHGNYPDTVTWHPLPPQQALPWHYTHMYVPVSYSML